MAGKWPALATWQVGRGRVAALMVTPLDDAPEASLPWWNWPPWPALMTNTTQWLLKR
jgi:hypothetical protein